MPRPSMNLVRVNFFCEPSVMEAYKWLAETRGTTYSELLRHAAKKYVLDEIKKEQEDMVVLDWPNQKQNAS